MIEEMLGPKGFHHFDSPSKPSSTHKPTACCPPRRESLSLLKKILPEKFHDRIPSLRKFQYDSRVLSNPQHDGSNIYIPKFMELQKQLETEDEVKNAMKHLQRREARKQRASFRTMELPPHNAY